MNLYSAHVILYAQLKSGRQRKFPVWENIVLFSAGSSDAAFAKAQAYGRAEADDEDDSFTWGGKPARWVFAGVRKVTPCHAAVPRNVDGLEVACNEYEMTSVSAIQQLVAGEQVELLLNDQFTDSAAEAPTRQSGRIVKKLA
ncbi:MAG: DUF4288 domain-containing protein [Pirellulaceae bacterium]